MVCVANMQADNLLEFLSPALPPSLALSLNALSGNTRSIVNTLAHLLAASKCPTDQIDLRTNWKNSQTAVAARVAEFNSREGQTSAQGQKRTLEDSDESSSQPSKKARTSLTPPDEPADDPPLFTLHSLSLTAPIRKKADITIHRSSIRLTNPGTHAQEHPPIPLSTLRAAFLLPTRGKTKPHWSILLLTTSSEVKDKAIQIAFGLDAVPPGFVTTSYASGSKDGERTAHPKGTPALESLRSFLSNLSIPIMEPSTSVFRSSSGEGGVEAYRGVKSGTLWFLREGILWDGRPAEWYPLSEIAKQVEGVDGVRTLSATGRNCSVFLRKVLSAAEKAYEREKEKEKGKKRAQGKKAETENEEEEEEEDEEEVIEIDFANVDGKEQDAISRWVKQYRPYFSKTQDSTSAGPAIKPPSSPIKSSVPAANGRTRSGRTASAIPSGGQEDEEDEEDEDFAASSSDSGSASGDSSDDGSDAGSEDVGSQSGSDDESEDDGEEKDDESGDAEEEEGEDEEEELDPAHHPLLRAGAMPKMSKAALNAVVGMMEADLEMGVGKGGTRGVESEESEEDELDD